jgi:hypothetical protein
MTGIKWQKYVQENAEWRYRTNNAETGKSVRISAGTQILGVWSLRS